MTEQSNNYALVALDATGSMSGRSDTVAKSMNEYVAALPEDTHISIFMFDSERWLSYFEGEVKDYPHMEAKDHVPGAMTPLYDACARLMAHGETLAKPGDRVMVMVDTDGLENASQEHTRESIKALVETRQGEGWAFLFMSEGLDPAEAGRNAQAGGYTGMMVQTASVSERRTSYRSAAIQTARYLRTGAMPENVDIDAEAGREKAEASQEKATPPGQAERTRPPSRMGLAGPEALQPPAQTRRNADPKSARPWQPESQATAADGR